MSKAIYSYEKETGVFVSEFVADESPLEPGVYLIPAFATDVKPPETNAHESAVFKDGAWSVVPDWRSVALYSTTDGSTVSAKLGDTLDSLGATDLPRPDAQHVWKDGAWTLDATLQAAAEAATRAALCTQIDDAVAAIYTRYTRFSDEYTLRLTQAQAYKDAGYTGTVPDQVAAYATPAGVTAQAAADLIISQAQAQALTAAIAHLGVLRMRKYEVKAAASVADAEAIATSVLAAIAAVGDALK